MNIKITSYNNFCNVKGVLNKQNVNLFIEELYALIPNRNSLTLSLEGLEITDRHGIRALAQLHNEFIRQQKKLSVIGLGTNEVYSHFKSNSAA